MSAWANIQTLWNLDPDAAIPSCSGAATVPFERWPARRNAMRRRAGTSLSKAPGAVRETILRAGADDAGPVT